MSTQHTLPDRLARLALFESLSPREREVFSTVLREHVVAPGQIMFDVGDRASECHVVLSGALEVFTRDSAGVATVVGAFGPGELMGEIALIDGGPRSAGCRGSVDGARLAALSKQDFDQIFSGASPFAFKLMDIVATRLVRRMRGQMAKLVEAVVEADQQAHDG